ncbi:MAG TPA: hypothetical protein DHV62_04155 [Elusimicrobia bacterium]|nr:hypothetical protein [Elusimicrobiota bacterium]
MITSSEKVTIAEIVPVIQGKVISGNPEMVISSFSTDTRTLKKGDFFIPLKGEKYDGHRFITQAITGGALGTLVSEEYILANKNEKDSFLKDSFTVVEVKDTLDTLQKLALYYRKKFKPFVIAITGSNGKTTTKELLGSILRKFAPTLVNYANWNNQIGLSLTLLQLVPVYRYCVLEMGTNHPGEIAQLSRIAQPEMVIFTNIGKAHLEFLKTTQDVFKEKMSVLDYLPGDGEIIYNADDLLLGNLPSGFRKTGFGIDRKTDFQASGVREENGKNLFFLHFAERKIPVSLPILGRFNVYNALAAIAAASRKGVNLELIIPALENFTPLPGRMNIIRLSPGTVLVNDCYNANPDSMRAAINWFLAAYPEEEKILVLGDMLELGKKSKEEHFALGEMIASLPVKKVLLFGKEIQFLAEALKRNTQIETIIFADKNQLAEEIKKILKPKGAILFKASRAMQLEEVVRQLLTDDR